MIDASDCFRKVKDYFSAVDAMYRANHIAECIQLVREYHTLIAQGTVQGVKPPRSTLTLERLCTEAAEEAHRRRDYITMRDFIRSMPSVTSQLEFAKSKGCTEAVVEILMEQKRGEEAAQILIQKEKYVDAVKCTENKLTIALCYLENSRILFHHWLRMGRNGYLENCELEELILPSIENVLSLLQDTGDKNLQSKVMLADALYMKSCLTGETDYAREASEIYSQTNNAVGAFLSNLFIYEEEKNISESFLKSLSQVMDLLASLLSLRRLTERQQNLVVECAHHVGYETVFDKGTLTGLILRNNYKMFTVSSQLAVESSTIRNPLEGSDSFGDVSSAKSCMAAMLLERVSEVLVRLRGSLQREQKSKKPCSRFLSGILHKQEECSLPHLTPTLESFKQVTEPLFKLMWLDNICRCFVAKLGEADKRPFDNHYSALIKKLSTPSSMIKTCDDFYNLFCDHTKFLAQHNLKAVNIKAILKDQNPVIRDQIRWYIEYYCSEQEEDNFLSDVNLFLKITSLSQLLGFHFPLSEIKVNKLRQKIQDKYCSNPPPRNVGVFWSGNRQCYELLHEGYIESMHFLYEKRNIIEGLYYFVIRFLHRAVSMTKNLRPPTLLNTSMLLEFHMSLCMMSLCRLSPNANLKIVLPDYYIQSLRLSSSLHAMCHSRSYDPFNSIAFIRDGKEDRLVNFFRAGIELMCGKTSEIFDMFFLSFLEAREGSHDISERFWILVLVLLCNSDPLKILLEAVYPLATAMFENIPKMMSLQGKMPERLATALTKAYYTKTGLQVLPILDSLLNNSGGSLVSCQWRLDAKKMWFSGFNPKDIVPKAVLKRNQTRIQLQQKDLDAVKMETVDDVPLTVQPAVADFSNAASSSVLHVAEEVVPPARIEVADDNDSTLRDLKEVDGRDMLPPIISKAPDHEDVASPVLLHTDRNASKDESFFIPSIAGAENDEDNSARRIYNDHPYRAEFGTDKDDSEQSLTISHLEYVENLEIYELDHQEFVEKDFKRAVLVIEKWYKERRLLRKQEIAACTIQRWFRKLQITKEESGSDEFRSGSDGLLDDQLGQSSKDLTKDHNDYMDYYRCRVCDITFQEESSISTNEQHETYKDHLLDGSNHWKVVKDYEEFVSFRDRFVIPFIAEAEKLKDRVDAPGGGDFHMRSTWGCATS